MKCLTKRSENWSTPPCPSSSKSKKYLKHLETLSVTQPMPTLWSRHPPSQRQKAGKPSRRTHFLAKPLLERSLSRGGPPYAGRRTEVIYSYSPYLCARFNGLRAFPLCHRKLGALHNGGWLRCLAPGLATRHLRWPVSIPDSRNWKISW